MISLPPLAQTIVIITLCLGYIFTFFFQRNKISVLIKTNNALKELTEGQKNHIDTYKQMVNISEIEQHFKIKIEKAKSEVYKEVAKVLKEGGGSDSYIHNWYKDLLSEYTTFFVIIAGNSNIFSKSFLQTFLPLNYPVIDELLIDYTPNIEIQKLLNE